MTCSNDELRAIVASLMKKEVSTYSRVEALQKFEAKNSKVFLEKLGSVESQLSDYGRNSKEEFKTINETLSGLLARIEAL